MPKQKTRKSVSKRFKVTGSGKLKRNKAGHSHMLIRRDKDVKRLLKSYSSSSIFWKTYEKNDGESRKLRCQDQIVQFQDTEDIEDCKACKRLFGARSRNFKAAKDAVTKAGLYAYRDRRQKKRQFRRLGL